MLLVHFYLVVCVTEAILFLSVLLVHGVANCQSQSSQSHEIRVTRATTFCASYAHNACFAPSCTAKQPFFVMEKSAVLPILEGPDLGHTTET